MVLAIEATHKLGFIHRDIKPVSMDKEWQSGELTDRSPYPGQFPLLKSKFLFSAPVSEMFPNSRSLQEGHLRISDFGLANDLHWAHDTYCEFVCWVPIL